MEVLGIVLSLVAITMAWYYGGRKKRLKNKMEGYKKALEVIGSYTSTTGYKAIIHDSFHSFSYCLCIWALVLAFQEVLSFFNLSLGQKSLTSGLIVGCLLYTSPSPRDLSTSRMPSSA